MSACPSAESLEQFLAGSLPGADNDALAAHVRACAACQARLDTLSDNAELRQWAIRACLVEPDGTLPSAPRSVSDDLPPTRVGGQDVDTAVSGPGRWAGLFEAPGQPGELGRLGPYRVQAELGRGGMGVVFRAYDEALARPVAVKVLRPELDEPAARGRLLREAQLAAQFRHDHVVTVHAVVSPPGRPPYLVMEYVPGPSLAALLATEKRLEPARAAELLVQVADGLAAAHAAGLVHRDVKPGNILLEPDTGRAKLTDFGLARGGATPSGLTQDGVLAGTPAYMSPEQARGEANLDRRTDVYSLGVTLYEALTGELPFRGTTTMLLQQILHEEPRPPRYFHDRIPRDLETICLKALAKEPGRRFQTAAELADDLRRWQKGEPIQARPAGPVEKARLWCRRRPLVAGLLAALVAVGVVGVSGIAWKWAEAERQRAQAERQRDEAANARAQAERDFRRARRAVDEYLTQITENRLLKSNNFQPLRRDLLRTAQQFYEEFVNEHPDDPDLQAERGRAYGRLGAITMILDSRPRGLEDYQRKRDIFERLHADHPDDDAYQDELADSWLHLGRGYQAMSKVAEAEDAFPRARALWEALARAHPDEPGYSENLMRTLVNQGSLYHLLHRPADAERAYRDGLAVHAHWAEKQPPTAGQQLRLAHLHLGLGQVQGDTRRSDLQAASFATAIGLFEQLARAHPEVADYKEGLAGALNELATMHAWAGQAEAAEAAWQRELGLVEELSRAQPTNTDLQNAVGSIHGNLGNLWLFARENPERAGPAYEKARAALERLHHDYPEVAEYRFNLGCAYNNLHALYQATGRAEAALEMCDRILALMGAAGSAPPKGSENDAATWHMQRAEALRQLGRHAESLLEIQRALQLCSADRRPEIQRCHELTRAHAWAAQGEPARAAAQAMALAAREARDGGVQFTAAAILARSAAAVRVGPAGTTAEARRLADEYDAQAVGLLEKARAAGQLNFPLACLQLARSKDFETLHERADFQKLLDRMKPRTGPR
jgi:tetratricopeptide (TPR) repeat protein